MELNFSLNNPYTIPIDPKMVCNDHLKKIFFTLINQIKKNMRFQMPLKLLMYKLRSIS